MYVYVYIYMYIYIIYTYISELSSELGSLFYINMSQHYNDTIFRK
jgi:hypothetical protein